jgi:hypothetical protein
MNAWHSSDGMSPERMITRIDLARNIAGLVLLAVVGVAGLIAGGTAGVVFSVVVLAVAFALAIALARRR